ncbi:MAG: TetR/AcrR family transcriptional regulator [Myxococcota bacterium]
MPKPTRRPQQRSAETRQRLVDAACHEFAQHGFVGASTRAIAQRADVAQSAIPFHFTTKEALWRAAAESLMNRMGEQLMGRARGLEGVDIRTRVRLLVTEFVRFGATHPHFHRFMLQEGKTSSERLDWLIDHHIRGFMEVAIAGFRALEAEGFVLSAPPEELLYMLIGASTMRYTVAEEFRQVTGQDAFDKEAIEAHAEAVVRTFFPQLAAPMDGARDERTNEARA